MENRESMQETMETPKMDLSPEANLNQENEPKPEETLEAKVANLEDQLAESNDKYLRLVAEMENLRKRTSKEVLDARKFGLESFFNQILPVLDSFDQAIQTLADHPEQRDGVLMIQKNLLNILQAQGFSEIYPEGQAFDPHLHQAIQRVESSEVQTDTVTQVFAKGYLLNGRLLRPAMVSVAIADGK
jgi:molecular chaperone GrpE